MKCKKCDLKNIKKIVFYDLLVQKCNTCKYIRIFYDDFNDLKQAVLLDRNIGNIKRYENDYLPNELEKRYINDFFKMFNIKSSNIKIVENICDVCGDNLREVTKDDFKFYKCTYCESIYFLQDDFEKFIKKNINKIYKKNYFFKIWFKIRSYIKNKELKLKEIFHKRMKNNVKK